MYNKIYNELFDGIIKNCFPQQSKNIFDEINRYIYPEPDFTSEHYTRLEERFKKILETVGLAILTCVLVLLVVFIFTDNSLKTVFAYINLAVALVYMYYSIITKRAIDKKLKNVASRILWINNDNSISILTNISDDESSGDIYHVEPNIKNFEFTKTQIKIKSNEGAIIIPRAYGELESYIEELKLEVSQ